MKWGLGTTCVLASTSCRLYDFMTLVFDLREKKHTMKFRRLSLQRDNELYDIGNFSIHSIASAIGN